MTTMRAVRGDIRRVDAPTPLSIDGWQSAKDAIVGVTEKVFSATNPDLPAWKEALTAAKGAYEQDPRLTPPKGFEGVTLAGINLALGKVENNVWWRSKKAIECMSTRSASAKGDPNLAEWEGSLVAMKAMYDADLHLVPPAGFESVTRENVQVILGKVRRHTR